MQLWKLIIFNPENDEQFGGVREHRWRAAFTHTRQTPRVDFSTSASRVCLELWLICYRLIGSFAVITADKTSSS